MKTFPDVFFFEALSLRYIVVSILDTPFQLRCQLVTGFIPAGSTFDIAELLSFYGTFVVAAFLS